MLKPIGATLFLIVAIAPLVAHHSGGWSGPCESSRELVTLTGTVTKVEWQNPHVHYFMNVRDAARKATRQVDVEMGAPHMLQAANPPLANDSIKVGDQLTVTGLTVSQRLLETETARMMPCGPVTVGAGSKK